VSTAKVVRGGGWKRKVGCHCHNRSARNLGHDTATGTDTLERPAWRTRDQPAKTRALLILGWQNLIPTIGLTAITTTSYWIDGNMSSFSI
jgi:hypothetical protein